MNSDAALYDQDYFHRHELAAARSASQIVPFIMSIIGPRSIADIGCGSGRWINEFITNGTSSVFACDGYSDWILENLGEEVEFAKIDLEVQPLEFPNVDLVCWLEVAEHLSQYACDQVMRYCGSRSDAILFSCAIPGQGGSGHINELWLSDWVHKFSEIDFICVDVVRPMFWDNNSISWWYRQNTVVFVRQGSKLAGELLKSGLQDFGGRDLVHPELLRLKSHSHGSTEEPRSK